TKLAELDPNSVRTVAYVPVEAKGGAALIALACDQLVMDSNAVIGIGPEAQAPPQQQRDNRGLPPQMRRPRGRRPPPPPPPLDDEPIDTAAAVATIRDSLAP